MDIMAGNLLVHQGTIKHQERMLAPSQFGTIHGIVARAILRSPSACGLLNIHHHPMTD